MESRLVLSASDMTAGAFDSMARRGKEAYGKVEQAAADSANGAALAIAGALGGALTFAGLAQFTLSIAQSIDALNDAADATGSTIEKMSALDDFARRTGTTLAEVTGVVLQLQKSLAKAGGDEDKGVAAALKSIGLSASELKKLDAADALKVLADRLAEFDDGPNKARLIQRLLKDATGASPILKDLAEQQELVGKVSKAQADEVDKLMKAWAGLTAEGHSFAVSVGNNVIPALNGVIDFARKASAEGGTLSRVLSTVLGGPALKAGGFVSSLVGPLDETVRATKRVQDAMSGLEDAQARLARSKSAEAAAPDLLRWAVTSNIRSATADVKKYSEELQSAQAELAELNKAKAPPSAGKPLPSVPDIPDVAKPIRAAKKAVDEFQQSYDRLLASLAGNSMKEVGLDPSYYKDLNTLFGGLQRGKMTVEEYSAAVEKLTTSQKFHQDAVSASAKAQEELIKLQESFAAMRDKEVAALEQEALSREQEAELYGLTAAAIARLTLRRAEDRLEQAKANIESEDTIRRLEAEVAARRRIAEATASIEVADANKKAADDAANEWKRVSDDIGRGLTDAIFEGGKDGWQLLKKTIEATIIRAYVQPAVTGAVQSMMGAGGGTSGAGGNGGFMSSLSNVNNMSSLANNASIGYQWYNGTMSGTNAAGTVFANTTNTGLDGLIASTEGWGTAPAAEAGISGWGAAGGMAAGALLGYNATDGNALGTFAGGALGTAGYGALSGAISGAGAYAGATAALAAIPVWGWVALAALAIGGSMVTGGTPHMGGAYIADSSGNAFAANNANAPGFGLDWGAYSSDRFSGFDAVAQASATGIAAQAKAIIEQFGGGTTVITAAAKFASDSDDWSQGAIRLFDATGRKIAELDKRYTEDANQAIKDWAADTPRILLQALQSSDLSDEMDALFKTLDPVSASLEEINALFAKAGQVQKIFALDSASAIKAANDASLSSASSFLKLGEALRTMAASGNYAPDDMLQALTERYNIEIAFIKSVADATKKVSESYGDSIRNVQLSVLDSEGKYMFLDQEAAKWMDILSGLTDPEQIVDYGERIRSNLDTSYGLLDGTQQQQSYQEFIDRYNQAEDLINKRLAESRQQAIDDQDSLAAAIKKAITESWEAAAKVVGQASDVIPKQIDINVKFTADGMGEVGVYVPNYAG